MSSKVFKELVNNSLISALGIYSIMFLSYFLFRRRKVYKKTKYACYIGYVTQAIVNNLAPLLFIVFHTKYNIGFEKLGRLVLFNFCSQIIIDIIAMKLVDRIGYRVSALIANACSTLGLILMSILPLILPPYIGLVLSISVYAIGGGFFEVIVSPIVENLPTDKKESNMALLHSFYCWGQAAVILVSTLLLGVIGMDKWTFLPILWATVPFFNFFLFLKVPIIPPPSGDEVFGVKELISTKGFLLFCLMMVCSGASELAMSQWASFFAEKGLNLSKTAGDLAGPFMFAVLMGTGRVFYAWLGMKRNLNIGGVIAVFSSLCAVCYLTAALSPIPLVSLVACALCGFSVSVMWPGVFSMSAKTYPRGGTAMFAILAIFGDIGAGVSPWITGFVSDIVSNKGSAELGIKAGLLACFVFPFVLIIAGIVKAKQKDTIVV